MTAPTLIYEQAAGEAPRVFANAESVEGITDALEYWAGRWLALGWDVRRTGVGYIATLHATNGRLLVRQCWAEVDPAICVDQLRAVLPGWLTEERPGQPLVDRRAGR